MALRLVIWTSIPTHHQAHFFAALRSRGIDLQVRYFDNYSDRRIELGWHVYDTLPPGESFVSRSASMLDQVHEPYYAVHIVTGIAHPTLRQVITELERTRTQWLHWSEPSHPGAQWWLSAIPRFWYGRKINKHALGAFAIGEMAARDFSKWGVRPEKIAYLFYASVPEGLDSAVPDPSCAEFKNSRRAFIYIGSQCRRKATDVLLSAFARLGEGADDWVLVCVGPVVQKYVDLARRLGIADRVLFRGTIPAEKIASALRVGDVLVLPSRFDGWGVVLNEGAAAGLPLIGSDMTGSAYHLIQPGKNGYRVRAGDAGSLRDAMQNYVKLPELIQRHGKSSLGVAEEFTPERNAERCISAIETWRSLSRIPGSN